MTKITFKDLPDTSTPLNANNLNTLQDNVENAISVVAGDIPTIDSSVSTSSTNPIENQAITNYVDEIEEIGTSNGWIYRKWRNGISECWKNKTWSVSVSNAWGTGLYYGTITGENFPASLFITTPTISFQNITGTSVMCMNSSDSSATNTGDIQVARGTSSSGAGGTISIHAIGKWKA